MAGNVWEWVQDKYNDTAYTNNPYSNPLGHSEGKFHILRGGSWADGENQIRVSARFPALPQTQSENVGFRCVLLPSDDNL